MARGSLERMDSGSYRIRWEEPRGADGKRKQRQKTMAVTKRVAEAELNRIIADLGKSKAEKALDMPVRELCRLFLEERRRTDLRIETVASYESLFRNYLLPECGELLLGKVDRNDLQKVIGRMIDRKLDPYTIFVNSARMMGLFSWAVRAEHLLKNPALGLSLPERSYKSAGQMLSAGDVVAVLAAFEGTPYWLPLFLAVHTGMRPGEVVGLSWDDVDLGKGTVAVHRTATIRCGGFHLGPPKTRSSDRIVAVSPEVVKVLSARERAKPSGFWVSRFRVNAEGKRVKMAEPMDFPQVCCLPDGRILSDGAWSLGVRVGLRRAGLKGFRLHDLRHTHASLLLLDGVPMHVVSKRLGHSNIQTTVNLYGHLLPSSDGEAAGRFEEILRVE